MKIFYTPAVYCCSRFILFYLLLLPVKLSAQESMRANLFIEDVNGLTLVDGNLTNYNNIYSNNVDINDGWKMTNPGINFGILRSGINLVVERRSIYTISDTTFFRMWNMPQYNYSIKFMLKNLDHPGMRGFIKDNYLNTETTIRLNDTTYFHFTVDANPASADQMRFQLIYTPNLAGPVDVNFTGINARLKGTDVIVQWEVASEVSIESYSIEHSLNGRSFIGLQQVIPDNIGSSARSYTYNDANVSKGYNFYRIKALSIGGRIQYSAIAKINVTDIDEGIKIYPNPVINKTVQLHFKDQPAGKCGLVLFYSNGTQKQLQSFQLKETQTTGTINLPENLHPGIYSLQFTLYGNVKVVKTLLVL